MMVFKTEKYIQWYRLKGCILFILTAFILLFACTVKDSKVVVQAATKTITVKKADTETAKKVHKYLYKGKALTLKVKGNSQKSKKLVKSLVKKVGVVNKYDVVFHYTPSYQSGKYYYYSVSRENAQLYKYSVKLMKRIFKKARHYIDPDDSYNKEKIDKATYPNERERNLHIIYDSLVRDALEWEGKYPYEQYAFTGYDAPTTQSQLSINSLNDAELYTFPLIEKYETDNEIRLYSYEEFLVANDEDAILKVAKINYLNERDKKVVSTPFYKLSDALKVYVVDRSMWFFGLYSDGYFGVNYNLDKRTPTTGAKGMKYLYKSKAYGVCVQFAQYECLLWDQLGITNYYNSSNKISHAWSVVKVKNSKGKTLWIPFDYGIGPKEGLSVRKDQYKYISTEKKRYKLYLSGIKGAPSKKNWKWSDFN